ncbi:hypothetical protein [Massilia sp. ZL223]|uniref:hypothetical protein n=1 Tax=Massilia sp. ZL223 TaxID=2824904 RepID=UPI001B820242|nr:hypothetical protein [Massilia sp. ZL223]MBQ5961930.1 hypothetical protein [Massilia sp. ZL223]
MRHKLKAVFDDRDKAQQALDELLASGYARADADLVTMPGVRSGSHDAPALEWPERPGTSTARWLYRSLARMKNRPVTADPQSDAADSHVLTLSTDNAQDAERASSLVSGFVHLSGEDAWTSVPARPADLANVAQRRTVAPGALQFYARDVDHYFGTHDAGDTFMIGTTYREPTLSPAHYPALTLNDGVMREGHADDDSQDPGHRRTSASTSADDAGFAHAPSLRRSAFAPGHPGKFSAWADFMDAIKHGWNRFGTGHALHEADYRFHHAHNYPGTDYNDLAPVYRYGHNVRRRVAFLGRGWNDVEGELRDEWERGHQQRKPATWEEIRAALHHGWDSMKD